MGILGNWYSLKGLWEYLNILDFLGAYQTESLTVFRDLFHDPSSGAQPKCTTYEYKHILKKFKSNKELQEYLNILNFLGATQTESLTVFRDLFHDPSSGAQPKCTTAV